jgi:hypothetical protein
MTRTAKENQEFRAYLAQTLANARVYVPGKVTPYVPTPTGGEIISGGLCR